MLESSDRVGEFIKTYQTIPILIEIMVGFSYLTLSQGNPDMIAHIIEFFYI